MSPIFPKAHQAEEGIAAVDTDSHFPGADSGRSQPSPDFCAFWWGSLLMTRVPQLVFGSTWGSPYGFNSSHLC